MGMGSSQYRLLLYTNRKADIIYEQQMLSNDRMALTREMQNYSKEYQEALNAKVLKWSNNAGVSYVDLTYNNLMTPSDMNQNKAYLITDSSNRVVLDSTYAEYAEMISPDGKPGGDWESSRNSILSSLTGIPIDTINSLENSQEAVWDLGVDLAALKDSEPEEPLAQGTTSAFLKNMENTAGINFSAGSDWSSAYNLGATISLGPASIARTMLSTIVSGLANSLKSYVSDPENLESAFQTFYSTYSPYIGDSSDNSKQMLSSGATPLTGDLTDYKVNVAAMMDFIMEAYASVTGNTAETGDGYSGQTVFVWRDINSTAYKNWQEAHAEWQTNYDKVSSQYETSSQAKNEALTAEQEKKLKFYDELFSTIAEKGWVCNDQIGDSDYLNQMLQNNLYTITTVDRNAEYSESKDDYFWDNEYNTNIASNCSNIFSVNDSEAREEALAEYEYHKSIINAKETKIDLRMQDLNTELDAVNKMIEGLTKVKDDNIDNAMDIFT